MTTNTINKLNQSFAISEYVNFESGEAGLPFIHISNSKAQATICLQGAHITNYTPVGQKPVIWMSSAVQYKAGKAIRGGIPICWPWFGGHPTDAAKPAHGFARNSLWAVRATEQIGDDKTRIVLQLTEDESSFALFPYHFSLQYIITIGEVLDIKLVAQNLSCEQMVVTSALHTYFQIDNIANTELSGLENTHYLDKFADGKEKLQGDKVIISEATDRVYLNTKSDCILDDKGNSRSIKICKTGSNTTVVWNPWAENAQKMADFGDDDYLQMICVEAANAAKDVVTLQEGECYTISQNICVMN
jgi:glucose-6-phosphate 1-epimerase